jgi:hypothetical protein
MKKVLAIIGSLVILIIFLFMGYMTGNHVGLSTGAQQYTKKLFSENEISISTSDILEQINNFRKSNNKPGLEESIGVCRIAQKRAEINFKNMAERWDSNAGSYKKSDNNDIGIDLAEAKVLCPECKFTNDKNLEDNYYGELSFIVLRPDLCIEANSKSLPCKGDESYSVTEHFPERVLKQWTENDSFKKMLLLDGYNIGCVRSYGGSVIFAIGFKKS